MPLQSLPALFMRGGTSKGLIFDSRALPAGRLTRDRAMLAAMGSPDPFGRQLDGMGGGLSSLSKVCIVGPASRPDADIDYTFGQVSVDEARVDYAGNCGNMVSAVGPAALEMGLLAETGTEACIRIHNTNTSQIIISHFALEDGRLASSGECAIDGVSGTGSPIRLDFTDPGGSKTAALLPTEHEIDTLHLPDGTEIGASLVDAANPCVFVAARDLGKSGSEIPSDLAADAVFMKRMEQIRLAGSVRMGLARDVAEAEAIPSIPKVAIVSSPRKNSLLDGTVQEPDQMELLVRMISMGQPHRALPITGAICLAAACRICGSIPNGLALPSECPMRLAHPSGVIAVDADVIASKVPMVIRKATIIRTARLLFSGNVYYRD